MGLELAFESSLLEIIQIGTTLRVHILHGLELPVCAAILDPTAEFLLSLFLETLP